MNGNGKKKPSPASRLAQRSRGSCNGDGSRQFSRIVRVVRRNMPVYEADWSRHTAGGLLTLSNGDAHRCLLTHDPEACFLALRVDLGPVRALSGPQLACLLRMQAQARLARFDHDHEQHRLMARTASVWPKNQDPSSGMSYMLRDLRCLLSDDRLKAIETFRSDV